MDPDYAADYAEPPTIMDKLEHHARRGLPITLSANELQELWYYYVAVYASVSRIPDWINHDAVKQLHQMLKETPR